MTFPLAALVLAAAAAPSYDALHAAWATCADAQGRAVSTLTSDEIADLTEGDLVKKLERVADDGARVLAVRWVDLPREHLWLAVQDRRHFPVVQGLDQVDVRPARGDELIYQHIDVPWPIQDRQWMIDAWNGADGEIWTRRWSTAPADLAPTADDEATWVDVNEGTWQLLEVEGGTLLVFSTRSLMGGAIPEEAGLRWALLTVDRVFEVLEQAAVEMPAHYSAAHRQLPEPGGVASLPPGSLAPCATVADCD